MKCIIDDKLYEIRECIKFKDRLLGLMFKRNISELLLFNNCKSIHTFFMFDNIDIIFLDNNNNILKTINSAPKWRIYSCKKAKKVLELPNNILKGKIKIVE